MELSEIWSVAGAVLASLGGGAVLVFALSSWLGKVWANRLMAAETAKHAHELELWRTELGKTLVVHGAQFEKEFSVYEEIWAKLVDVRRAVLSLRPMMDRVDPNEDEDERRRNRLERLDEHFREFLDVVDKNRPFYAEEVWSELRKLIDQVHGEAIDYQYKDGRSVVEYYREGKENGEKILAQIERVCEGIRGRVRNLAVPTTDLGALGG